MTTMNVSKAAKNMDKILESVANHGDPVVIKSKNGNGILVSLEEWTGMQETLYIMSNPKLAEKIRRGMEEPIEDCIKEEDLDWDNLENYI